MVIVCISRERLTILQCQRRRLRVHICYQTLNYRVRWILQGNRYRNANKCSRHDREWQITKGCKACSRGIRGIWEGYRGSGGGGGGSCGGESDGASYRLRFRSSTTFRVPQLPPSLTSRVAPSPGLPIIAVKRSHIPLGMAESVDFVSSICRRNSSSSQYPFRCPLMRI